jgi:hypothetical protein
VETLEEQADTMGPPMPAPLRPFGWRSAEKAHPLLPGLPVGRRTWRSIPSGRLLRYGHPGGDGGKQRRRYRTKFRYAEVARIQRTAGHRVEL